MVATAASAEILHPGPASVSLGRVVAVDRIFDVQTAGVASRIAVGAAASPPESREAQEIDQAAGPDGRSTTSAPPSTR